MSIRLYRSARRNLKSALRLKLRRGLDDLIDQALEFSDGPIVGALRACETVENYHANLAREIIDRIDEGTPEALQTARIHAMAIVDPMERSHRPDIRGGS